ncbi:MAG TPA: hypothetical protein VJB64_02520 [Patescibacteria group bacterium]|nr:hypothetical protein [Patescibacteria group bacterium]
MTRLPRILSFLLVFGSMWLYGSFAMPSVDHTMGDMMSPSCLEHCLSTLHLDVADDGVGVSAVGVIESPVHEKTIHSDFSSTYAMRVESHHDPSQILTIQKRE